MPRPYEAIYNESGSRFSVDTCAPQFAAMREGKIRLCALTKCHYPGVKLAAKQLQGITSIGYFSGVGTQDWGMDPHRNEGLEITFLETGSMNFSVESKNYELRPGNFTTTRPWQLHKLGAPNIGPGKLHWLILDVGVRRPNQKWHWPRWLSMIDDDREELEKKLRQNQNAVWVASPEIAEVFRGLGECIDLWPSPRLESRLIALLNRLFVEVLITFGEQQSFQGPHLASQHTVDLFLRDLAANPASAREPWTLPQMASHCGMGVTAFSNHCRSLVNAGGIDYLIQCRLQHTARELRKIPHRPITEIAFECGFNSSQYFATVFGRRFKMTPRDYRKNER
jgi:AraC family L-rhamnose operon regulatory protein RhaS